MWLRKLASDYQITLKFIEGDHKLPNKGFRQQRLLHFSCLCFLFFFFLVVFIFSFCHVFPFDKFLSIDTLLRHAFA